MPRMVRKPSDTAIYFIFENRIHRETTAAGAYKIGRAWGLLAPSQTAANVAELIGTDEFDACSAEITAANLAQAQRIGAQVPVTVQGASEAFINSSLGQVIVNSNTNTNFLGASIINRKNEIIARIDATHPS